MMTVTLTGEARARLDKHLDAVEAALSAAGNSREQRRGVVDDLESQILDMLAARSPAPTLEDVEAVLGQVDPPSAYGAAAGSTPPPPISAPRPAAAPAAPAKAPPRYSRTAIWGLVCILVSFLPMVILLPLALFVGHTHYSSPPRLSMDRLSMNPHPPEIQIVTPLTATTSAPATQAATMAPDEVNISAGGVHIQSGHDTVSVTPGGVRIRSDDGNVTVEPAVLAKSGMFSTAPCFACLVGPLGLLGTVLGWVAFGQIRGSKGALHGTGLALFDGLFYPIVAVLLALSAILFAA